jgi:threonine synthase
LAHAIVDMVGNRKEHIAQILHSSHGSGWIATDEDILQIQKIIAEEKITDQEKPLVLSPNSALSVAGLMIALKNGWKPNGPVACLITGP